MENRCVVSVGTEAFKRGNTYFYGRTLRVIKSLTTYNLLEEECQSVGTQDGLENILNLQTVEDGRYSVEVVNISRDWETGHTDGWDIKLVPFEEA